MDERGILPKVPSGVLFGQRLSAHATAPVVIEALDHADGCAVALREGRALDDECDVLAGQTDVDDPQRSARSASITHSMPGVNR